MKAYVCHPDVAFAINVLREKTLISKSPSAHHYVWNSIASDQNFHNDHVLLYLRKRVQVIWQICLQGHGACRRGPFQSWRWPSPCLHRGWGLCQPMGGQWLAQVKCIPIAKKRDVKLRPGWVSLSSRLACSLSQRTFHSKQLARGGKPPGHRLGSHQLLTPKTFESGWIMIWVWQHNMTGWSITWPRESPVSHPCTSTGWPLSRILIFVGQQKLYHWLTLSDYLDPRVLITTIKMRILALLMDLPTAPGSSGASSSSPRATCLPSTCTKVNWNVSLYALHFAVQILNVSLYIHFQNALIIYAICQLWWHQKYCRSTHLVLILAHKGSEVKSSSICLLMWQD